MVIVSCPGKFHAFALAEQLNRNNFLTLFYTSYAYQKNTWFRNFAGRKDNEKIPRQKIETYLRWSVQTRLRLREGLKLNEDFDRWVASKMVVSKNDYKVFIGWASISLHSILQAKKDGKVAILERGSTHIVYQNTILREEYKSWGQEFTIHPSVIKKELKEYQEVDYISIPSSFVKRSFIEQGVDEKKLIVNPYGASDLFIDAGKRMKTHSKFTVVYLGTLSVRKGLLYLFQAIHQLTIPKDDIEFWFIGKVAEEVKSVVEQYRQENWKFLGHINHYQLQHYLSQSDVGVQPSLEEGLSMVIPQLMACGVPVIATPNTGAEDLIRDGTNGYIVPVRQPSAIAEKISLLYGDRERLENMRNASIASIRDGFTWNDYGNRYRDILNRMI